MVNSIKKEATMFYYKDFTILFPKAKESQRVYKGLSLAIQEYKIYVDINLDKKFTRLMYFLAQCAHESAGFSDFDENLNYTSKGLIDTFGKYFYLSTPQENKKDVIDYANKPKEIANYVYANRMGNGDEQSGDGWAYRGMGVLQITGKEDHNRYAESIEEKPKNLLLNPFHAAHSAGWFWNDRKINKLCDNEDFHAVTLRINGGYHGTEERLEWLEKITNYFKAKKIVV